MILSAPRGQVAWPQLSSLICFGSFAGGSIDLAKAAAKAAADDDDVARVDAAAGASANASVEIEG